MSLEIPDIPTLLIFAGILFIFLAIIGKFTSSMFSVEIISEKRAIMLGVAGIILLVLGLIYPFLMMFFSSVVFPNNHNETTVTAKATITPTSVAVKITKPKDGSDFPILDTSKIIGIISNVPNDQHLWVILLKTNDIYYPFPNEPVIYGHTWQTISYGVGEDNEEEDGDTFIIGAYLLDEKAYEEIKEYVKKASATNAWDGMNPLPEGAIKYDEVGVIGRL